VVFSLEFLVNFPKSCLLLPDFFLDPYLFTFLYLKGDRLRFLPRNEVLRLLLFRDFLGLFDFDIPIFLRITHYYIKIS
jgi:hypothetical protein